MHTLTIRGFALWTLVLALLPNVLRAAEEVGELPDWEMKWAELETRDELSSAARLGLQVEILADAGRATGWRDARLWERGRLTLNELEASPDIAPARLAYLSLLSAIGTDLGVEKESFTGEALLRGYYQRALGITVSAAEEGQLLFLLAESLLRSEPLSPDSRRKAEAFLQQASSLLPAGPPGDAVHTHLGAIYSNMAQSPSPASSDEESYLSRAVFHYRQVLAMEPAREVFRELARQQLDALLESGLSLQIAHRFLPQSDVRISVNTRNLEEISIEVYSLPWRDGEGPLSMDRLTDYFRNAESSSESAWISETFPLPQRARFERQTTEIRLGQSFPGGWYWIKASSGDLSDEGLFLVSPIEVVAIPRSNGSLTLWAVDAESGLPLSGAEFHVYSESGERLLSAVGDTTGKAEVEVPEDADWKEVHVTDGINPAVIRKEMQTTSHPAAPLIFPGAIQVRPGNSFEWIMTGFDILSSGEFEALLPSGQGIEVELSEIMPGIIKGRVDFPLEYSTGGPVYLDLGNGEGWLLTHLRRDSALPFNLTFSGERVGGGNEVFLSTSPVGVRVLRGSRPDGPSPEFIRLRVSKLSRSVSRQAGGSLGEAYVLHEQILRMNLTEEEVLSFELPDVSVEGSILPLKIEIMALETGDLLGTGIVALAPYKSVVDLRISEQVILEGDPVGIELSLPFEPGSSSRSTNGELVVYRERWESRYIHRKRGTLLTEDEYLALPDRSLLGSAKTDYRLQESGFTREAVDRISIRGARDQVIPVTLEQSGYYHIEFEGEDVAHHAHYPDGDLEVWVIPESGDLKTLRSEEPRLIHERTADGADQILVLLDRSEIAVLLDMEFADGRVVTEVLQPDSNAVYRVFPISSASGISRCQVIVTGERETVFLSSEVAEKEDLELDLEAGRTSGLNPGALVNWPLVVTKGQWNGPSFWAFYPESSGRLLNAWLSVQLDERRRRQDERQQAVSSLGQWLPLYDPLKRREAGPVTKTDDVASVFGIGKLHALYPELVKLPSYGEAPFSIQTISPEANSESLVIETKLPGLTGRWEFAVFNPSLQQPVDLQYWTLSTELPIRTKVTGPAVMRQGDKASASLDIENTTRRQETLQVAIEASGSISISERAGDVRVMAAGARGTYPVPLAAEGVGGGLLQTNARGAFSSSDADFEFTVVPPSSHPDIKAFLVRPGEAEWQREVALQDWSSARLLVSSGLGAVLSEVWPLMRDREASSEPLLAALGDWAFAHVKSHHGLLSVGSEIFDNTTLVKLLDVHASAGGWSWTPGTAPDPWLSALILWSLETFSGISGKTFVESRKEARSYLESMLFDKRLDDDARLLALRALAVPAFNNPRIRPSRIQAKSFLEFLHRRGQLSNANLASLLQVARAFHFTEEVRLLLDDLKARFPNAPSLGGGFWGNSLVYLALAEGSSEDALRAAVLRRELELLASTGPARSWEQFGGYMNLLAAFLWEGDFNVDGSATVVLNNETPHPVSLKPHGPEASRSVRELDPAVFKEEPLMLELDTRNARLPVSVVLMGERISSPMIPAYPEQSIRRYREYREDTLLSGSRMEIVRIDSDPKLYPGDTLQVHITLYAEEVINFAEFVFAVPAGTSLSSDSIQHSYVPSSEDEVSPAPQITHMDQLDELSRIVRMEPFAPGRHEFILSYRINWAGEYLFPASRLILPKSGRIYSLGEPRMLEISERTDEESL